MDIITKLKSSELFNKVNSYSHLYASKSDALESSYKSNIIRQTTHGLHECFRIYFRQADLQKVDEKSLYTDYVYPDFEQQILSSLIDTVEIYETFSNANSEIVPLGNKSDIVDYICEYVAAKQSIIQGSSSLNFNSIVKRQIILQTIRDCQSNGGDYSVALKSQIEFLGVDDKAILFYPTKDSYCVFDIICTNSTLLNAFVSVIGKKRFVEYLTSKNLIKNNDIEFDVPLIKYLYMCCVSDGFSDKLKDIMSHITSEFPVNFIQLDESSKIVVAKAIVKLDIPVIDMLKLWIDDFTVYTVIIESQKKDYVTSLKNVLTLENLDVNVNNVLFALNVPTTKGDFTAISTFINNSGNESIKNLIKKLKKDVLSLTITLLDSGSEYITDMLYSVDEEKLDNYFEVELSDKTQLKIETINFFTGISTVTSYLKHVNKSNDTEGLNIIKSSFDDLLHRYDNNITPASTYIDYYVTLGLLMLKLNMQNDKMDEYLCNQTFVMNIALFDECSKLQTQNVECLIDGVYKNVKSMQSLITLQMLRLVCSGETIGSKSLAKKKNYSCDVAMYMLTMFGHDYSEGTPNLAYVGKHINPNMFDYVFEHNYIIATGLIPYLNESVKGHVKTNLTNYIDWRVTAANNVIPEKISFIETMIESNVLTEKDFVDFVNGTKNYSKNFIFVVLNTSQHILCDIKYVNMFETLFQNWEDNVIHENCIDKLMGKLKPNEIQKILTKQSQQKIAKYCSALQKYQNKELSQTIYLELMTDSNIFPTVSCSIYDSSVEYINEMFKISSQSLDKCNKIEKVTENFISYISNTNYNFGIPSLGHFANLFKSKEFCDRFANALLLIFTQNPVEAMKTYDRLNVFVQYVTEELGQSNIYTKDYWNYINSGGRSNINSFLTFSAGYGQQTVLIKHKLKLLKAYLDTHEKPCEYNNIKETVGILFKKIITDSEMTSLIISIIDKFNGLYEFMSTNDVADNLFSNITLCKSLLSKLSHEQQKQLLESNDNSTKFIMDNDFSFFLDLVDKFGISTKIDINNKRTLAGLQSIDASRVYSLHSNGFLKCNLWELVVKLPDLIDLPEIKLTDKMIDSAFEQDDCSDIVIKVLNKLHKLKDKQYTDKFCKIVTNFISSDPFGLSDFLSKVTFSFEDLKNNSENLDKIYELCEHDPSLYSVMYLNNMSDMKLIEMKMLNGDLMLSYFKDNKIIMKGSLPYVSINVLFEKNRIGKYVIESLLTSANINILSTREDFEEIQSELQKLNISEYSELEGIDVLLESSSTSSNKFMIMCRTITSESLLDILLSIDEQDDIDKLMTSMDDTMNNGLFYVARYHSTVLEYYVNEICNSAFLSVNVFGETLGMYTMRYNITSFNILNKNGKITKDHNYVNINTGSLISYAAKYSEDMFESVLESSYFNKYSIYVKDVVDMIDFSSEDMTRVKCSVNLTNVILSKGNVEAFVLFKQKYPTIVNKHLNELFNIGEEEFYTLKYAFLVEPDIASVIVGSSACTSTMLDKFCNTFPDGNFSCIALIQPASWQLICNSSKFTSIKPKQSNNYHYGKKTNLAYIVENATEEQKTLIKHKQSYNFVNKNVCKICLNAKATILHSKCGHKMCVSCSLVENKCTLCKINTPLALQYYIE